MPAGRAAALLLHDPRIQPGAFALVGMGTLYGGIAHVPLSALVLVCELAGNYDLLVPLMLTQGIAFVALRNRSLYSAQVPGPLQSPAHRDTLLLGALQEMHVRDVMRATRAPVCFLPKTPMAEMLAQVSRASDQDVFPVLDTDEHLVGLVVASTLRVASAELSSTSWTLATDLMLPPVSVRLDDDMRRAVEAMLNNGLRELPVVDDAAHVLGILGESDLAEVYLKGAVRPDRGATVQASARPPAVRVES